MRRFIAGVATGLAVLLILSACTPASHRAADNPADFETHVKPTWSASAELVGNPVIADGYVASYLVGADGVLKIAAWNLKTGKQTWSDVAVPGAVTPGVDITASKVESNGTTYIAYLGAEGGDEWQVLTLADISTGEKLGIGSPVIWANSRPASCVDGHDVCFLGYVDSDKQDQRTYRLNLQTRLIEPDDDAVVPAGSRMLGNRVFSTNSRPPDGTEMLGYSHDGEIKWQRPYTDVFGAGSSSDGGWDWLDNGKTKLLVGSGSSYDEARTTAATYTIDLTQRRLVGLDPTDGSTVWSLLGVGACPFADLAVVGKVVPVCKWDAGTETVNRTANGTSNPTYQGVKGQLLGIDPNTGKSRWSVTLGSSVLTPTTTTTEFAGSARDVLLPIAGKLTELNLGTGSRVKVPAAGIFACTRIRARYLATFPGIANYPNSVDGKVPFSTGSAVSRCSVSAKASKSLILSPEAIRIAGVSAGGGTYVVSGARTLSVYRLPA